MLLGFGGSLMLDLSLQGALESFLQLFWHRQQCYIFLAAASLSALVSGCSIQTYSGTLLLFQVVLVPSLNGCRPLSSRWPTSGMFLYILWPDKLGVLRPSQGGPCSLFPLIEPTIVSCLLASSSGNQLPFHFVCPTTVVTYYSLTNTIKAPFIDLKWGEAPLHPSEKSLMMVRSGLTVL